MQTHHVAFESHQSGATIYIAGILGSVAATQAEESLRGISKDVFAIRLDLRAVVYIDPDAFVRVARSLRRWREARGGRVMLEFPERSQPRRAARNAPVNLPSAVGVSFNPIAAVSTV